MQMTSTWQVPVIFHRHKFFMKRCYDTNDR